MIEPFVAGMVDELTGKPVLRCLHVSEIGDKQCIRVSDGRHTEAGLHSFGNCSWCDFTYEPCPVHEPTAHAAHTAWESEARDKVMAARDELRDRKGELPEWAQRAIKVAL